MQQPAKVKLFRERHQQPGAQQGDQKIQAEQPVGRDQVQPWLKITQPSPQQGEVRRGEKSADGSRAEYNYSIMKNIYRHTEKRFEKLASVAIAILGNSITFIIALCTVIFWLSNKRLYMQDIHDSIRDIILGVTFLS